MKREEPEPMVPADLRKVFAAAPKAKAQWSELTPLARKDFIMWIDSAKQSDTRKRRIESIPSRLASGKRRPCCFAIVPFDLHKVLAGTPRRRLSESSLHRLSVGTLLAGWLRPKTRRRAGSAPRRTCLMIETGKRRP